jgi:hypothetical protein
MLLMIVAMLVYIEMSRITGRRVSEINLRLDAVQRQLESHNGRLNYFAANAEVTRSGFEHGDSRADYQATTIAELARRLRELELREAADFKAAIRGNF